MQPVGVRVARQGPACERGRPLVGRRTPPELVLYGGVIVGYGWLDLNAGSKIQTARIAVA